MSALKNKPNILTKTILTLLLNYFKTTNSCFIFFFLLKTISQLHLLIHLMKSLCLALFFAFVLKYIFIFQ